MTTTVGALRERVAVQRNTPTRDDIGGLIQSWATIATLWAEVKPISAGEQFRRQQIQANATHKVTIRYRNDLLPSDRIVWRGRTFQLKGEMNEDQRRRFSTWACEELQVALTRVGYTFGTINDVGLTGDNATAHALTVAMRFKKAAFDALPSSAVSQAKVFVNGPVTRLYIGHQGGSDAWDSPALTQVLFDGAPGLSQALGTITESDPVAFAWDGSSDIIVAAEWTNVMHQAYRPSGYPAGKVDTYYKLDVMEADVANRSGYSGALPYAYGVTKIQLNGF